MNRPDSCRLQLALDVLRSLRSVRERMGRPDAAAELDDLIERGERHVWDAMIAEALAESGGVP